MNIPIKDVYNTLAYFMGGKYVNDFTRIGKIYRVYIQADAKFRMTPEALGELYVRSSTGQMVPLSTLTKVERTLRTGISEKSQRVLSRLNERCSPEQGYSTGDLITAVGSARCQLAKRLSS